MKIVYIDTETTKLNPGQICEMSVVVEEDFAFKEAKDLYFKVDKMDEGAQKVHGLSIEDLDRLSGGKVFADYKDEIYDLVKDSIIVAHNLPFDEKFISQEFWRCGISFCPGGRMDTMSYFKPILRLPARSKKYGPYKNPKLSELVDYFGIRSDAIAEFSQKIFNKGSKNYHDSAFDATALYVIVNTYREIKNGGDFWYKNFCLSRGDHGG